MPIVEMDERGRIIIPKELRKIISAEHRQPFLLKLSDSDTVILKKIERRSRKGKSLISLIKKPLHVLPEKLKKIDLEKIEEEMWSS